MNYIRQTLNRNFRSINIAHSTVTVAFTKIRCWPQTKEVTIITVLSKYRKI